MRLRAEQHIRRQRDFRDVRELGRRLECGGFVLWYYQRSTALAEPAIGAGNSAAAMAKEVSGPRVGVIASGAAVGNAVRRNRAKRRLREVFRCHQTLVPPDYDLLLTARTSLNRLPYAEIEKRFIDACRRLFPAVR